MHSHQGRTELNVLASDVVRLSRLLTREREGLPAVYLNDAGLRRAYVSYFLPANRSKIHLPLGELSLHRANTLFTKKSLRILDVGSGPGTASLGILEYFSRNRLTAELKFTAVDQARGILRDAEALFSSRQNEAGLTATLTTIQADLGKVERQLEGAFDLIVLSNVLNELHARDETRTEKRVAIVAAMLERLLADDGSCIVIEPALRETSRDLLTVRDGLLSRGFHVYSPCLHEGACPALGNPKDWCHEEVFWDPPKLVREIDNLTGLRKDSLKFSYLVLRKDRLSLAGLCGPQAFRVVSEPLASKGKTDFYVCGGGARKLLTRLDKDATVANRLVDTMARGNIIIFEDLADEGKRFKIQKETTVLFPFAGKEVSAPGTQRPGQSGTKPCHDST